MRNKKLQHELNNFDFDVVYIGFVFFLLDRVIEYNRVE